MQFASVDEPSFTHGMKIWSPAFANGQPIPAVYARKDGNNVSPPLEWSDFPADLTKSLALIVDDPDAPDPANPKMTWVHWVLYNIPPTATRLEEGAGSATTKVGVAGHNDWKLRQYDGPAPPTGQHRYFFKLYALDTMLDEHQVTDKASFLKAADKHIVRFAELVGTYEKK